MCFLPHFNSVRVHLTLSKDKQDLAINIDFLDSYSLKLFHFLLNCVLFAHVDICYVDAALFVSHIEELLVVIPANRCKQTLVRVCHTEELIFVLAETFNSLIISYCEDTTLFLHHVEDLHNSKLVKATFLISS